LRREFWSWPLRDCRTVGALPGMRLIFRFVRFVLS
jgi:hypothetical protein